MKPVRVDHASPFVARVSSRVGYRLTERLYELPWTPGASLVGVFVSDTLLKETR